MIFAPEQFRPRAEQAAQSVIVKTSNQVCGWFFGSVQFLSPRELV